MCSLIAHIYPYIIVLRDFPPEVILYFLIGFTFKHLVLLFRPFMQNLVLYSTMIDYQGIKSELNTSELKPLHSFLGRFIKTSPVLIILHKIFRII
jgi:hypothetical protein